MDELENLMIELGADDYLDDMDYLQYLLKKEKESKERIIQMIALLFATNNKRKTMKAINEEIDKLFAFLTSDFSKTLKNRFDNTYNKTIFNMQKTIGGVEVKKATFPFINWHINNQSYIDDLEYYKNRLKYDLKIVIDRGIVLKQNVNEVTMIAEKPFKTLSNSTKSMVDTELTYIERQANATAYETQGIKEYRYVAALDSVTCDKCAELDEIGVFKFSDKEVGVNYPPIHSHCRCVVVANMSYKERSARDKAGKTILIDGDMTYEKWKKEYT